jgi:DNA-binding CsgD family transcriptional regulator
MDGFGIAAGMNFPGFPHAERLERLRKMAVGYPDPERFAATMTAQYLSALGESREEAVKQALRANEMSDDRSAMALLAYLHGCIVFNRAEEFELASRYVETLVNTAPLAGKPLFAEYGHGLGGVLAFHTGRLADAVDEMRAAIAIRDSVSRGAVSPSSWEGTLIRAELARGEIVAAEAILASVGAMEQWQPFYYAPVLLAGRGLVRAHLGDLEGALADHRESGRRQAEFEVINPADNPWRSRAALLCHRLDRQGEAEELVREELALARTWGAPGAIGVTLSALGRVTSDIEPLAESLALLENTPSRLPYAASAFHLGLMHRASHRSDARAFLEIAHRVATECGADRLAEQSAQALTRVAGRRPNAPKFGAEALTAQERRIAERAALGAGNRQIAEELFLTLRTVEHHLTAVYRKLGVEGRAGLAGLGDGDSSAGP